MFLFVFLFGSCQSINAEIVFDMEGIAPAGSIISTGVIKDNILVGGGNAAIVSASLSGVGVDWASNGTDYMYVNESLFALDLDGRLFNAQSFDATEFRLDLPKGLVDILVVGQYANGTATYQNFDLDDLDSFQTFEFNSSFRDLNRISLVSNAQLAIDNLVLDIASVPEPSSAAMFSAVVGVAWFRRRPR